MTNLLQNGATSLIGWLKDSAGRTVRYERGGETLIAELVGTCAAHDYDVVDSEGVLTTITAFDWCFEATDFLDASDSVIDARPGDRIVESLSGIEYSYEPLPLGPKPVQEWADSSGVMVMVHTKRVKVNRGDE